MIISQKLVFVYNADSGFWNGLVGGAHKLLSPTTYQCSLCKLTHGAFAEKKLWTAFRKELVAQGFELDFLHKDEFGKVYRSKFGHKFTYPIVLVVGNNGLEILIHTHELNALESPQTLMVLVRERLTVGSR